MCFCPLLCFLPYLSPHNLHILVLCFQPWKDVSPAAKDFVNKVLLVNPAERMTSAQCLKHPWIASAASQSNLKNLHHSISQNWLKRTSTRSRSSRSVHSNRSVKSQRSGKSMRSSRSQRLPPLRKVCSDIYTSLL